MNNAKEIKVHDTVWVNLNTLFGSYDDALVGYAEVLHIEENKGATYYDVRFRGSDEIFYDVEGYCVHPITSTGDVLPNMTFADIFYTDKAEDAGTPQHDKHYRDAVVEPILVMQAFFSREELIGFLKGNILKYRLRAGHKGTANDMKADIDKIRVYEKWLKAVKNGDCITL